MTVGVCGAIERLIFGRIEAPTVVRCIFMSFSVI